MPYVLFIGLMLSFQSVQTSEMDSVRMQFHEIDSEESLKAFIKMTSAIKDTKATPYKEAAIMRQAEFTANPFRKLKYFNAGKKRLETYINHNPFDIEARYVRALIQSGVPEILNYNKQFEADTKYVLDSIDASELSNEYKILMIDTLKQLINNTEL